MKKRFSAKKLWFARTGTGRIPVAGTAPVFAQSSGVWSAGISTRSGTPNVHTQSTNVSGSGGYAQVPATIRHPVLEYSTAPAFAQSSGSWSAGISGKNGRPFLSASSTNHSGYDAYAMILDRATAAPASLRRVDRFGGTSQR
jgi:hypothetical protein